VNSDIAVGDHVTVLLRPEIPRPIRQEDGVDNVFRGHVAEAIYLGNAVKYRVIAEDGSELLVRWTISPETGSLRPGSQVAIGWLASEGHVLHHSRTRDGSDAFGG
jgi:hypothetical protein